MTKFPDYAQLANIGLIEDLYSNYCIDPESVDPSWRHFFEGIDFAAILHGRSKGDLSQNLQVFQLIEAYRRYGHIQADFNPLEKPKFASELSLDRFGFVETDQNKLFPTYGFCEKKEAPLSEIVEALKNVYSSRIGFEYKDLNNLEMEKWIQNRIEPKRFR